MKKVFLALGLGFTLAANVFAADNTIEQLNSEIVTILAPFQDEATVANLYFNALETNAERALQVAVTGLYRKIGPQNTVALKIDNISYDYGNGLSPTTIVKGSAGVDLSKLMSQEEINRMFDDAAELIEDVVKKNSEEYGDAASIKGIITSTSKDVHGNYTGLTALLTAKIDLSKLPEGMESEDVIATDAALSIALNVKTGLTVEGFVVSNPEFRGFKEDQEGLKEFLDKLLARDEEEMQKIQDLFMNLDYIAGGVVGLSKHK